VNPREIRNFVNFYEGAQIRHILRCYNFITHVGRG
jgi:hypothetical protein